MSKQRPFQVALLIVLAMAVASSATPASGAEAGLEAARLDSFAHTDGTNYFALSFQPAEPVAPADAHDVVVLFDTSATQTGDYRAEALATLNSLLSALSDKDRVQLVAVDVNAIGMTKDFVAPESPEMADAIMKLERRVPLGATDMEKALRAAAARYAEGGANARAVVYIGDGMSTTNLLGTRSFEQLVASLVDSQIAVSSYAVGPRCDVQVLGALAANTGGQLVNGTQVAAEKAGSELAAAARAAVLWPESTTWPGGFSEVFPRRIPPLRPDRATIILGTYKGEGPFEIQMTVDTAEGAKPLQWTVAPNPPQDVNSYIARLVESARIDGGISLPLVGSESLKAAERAADTGVRQITQLAVQALQSGDLENAARLAREALRQAPEDVEARILAGAVQRRRAEGPDALHLVGPGPPSSVDRPELAPFEYVTVPVRTIPAGARLYHMDEYYYQTGQNKWEEADGPKLQREGYSYWELRRPKGTCRLLAVWDPIGSRVVRKVNVTRSVDVVELKRPPVPAENR